ncbi:hypothetical protein GCM10009775_01770 [Microbacterium aoyamense]|uniref:Uncharacterized protein n=1 Tax=Microbacterium aoyamense TaxID=344166 RepID=A0ABP5AFU8_9MICO|nr:hypothetical protein [Microbacterium aoyamense]
MIQGDVEAFLKALGAREGDPLLEQALAVVAGEYEVDVFDDADAEQKYLVAVERGVEFLLEDGIVTTVFVYAADRDDQRTYGRWPTLVEGIDRGFSADEIVAALGAPQARTPTFLRYAADGGFVQFDFDGARLSMLVVMREVVVPTADVPARSADGAPSVPGELDVFVTAVGRPLFSPEHFAVIGLAGDASESFDVVRAGVEWQVEASPRTGVRLEFREEILARAVIRLVESDGDAAYPHTARLIDGLPLPSGRDALCGRFGAPHRAEHEYDLYLVGDSALRFDFDRGASSVLTVTSRAFPD